MGTIVGVIVGYAIGTRAGEEGWSEFVEAWKVITTSEEVRDLVAGGFVLAKGLLGRGGGMLSDALGNSRREPLRPVA